MIAFWKNLVYALVILLSIRKSMCNENVIQLGKWCLSFHKEPRDRETSKKLCERNGGDLLWFDSKEKLHVVRKHLEAEDRTDFKLLNRESLLNSHQKIKDIHHYGERFCRIYKNNKSMKPSRKMFMKNRQLPIVFDDENRANLTTPTGFSIEPSSIPGAGLGAWAKVPVRMFSVIGEYEGDEHTDNEASTNYQWNVR
uniref:Uncharacterized protein LOC111124153 n=1 Tax=Crassostrea virginica TaxID=6565 RepID=A0A8B8D4X5_CRAVI|nr:uncharacterized protein LOC111124153 [Crassostrea virginica]